MYLWQKLTLFNLKFKKNVYKTNSNGTKSKNTRNLTINKTSTEKPDLNEFQILNVFSFYSKSMSMICQKY